MRVIGKSEVQVMVEGDDGINEHFKEILARFRELWEGLRSRVQGILSGIGKAALAVRRAFQPFVSLGRQLAERVQWVFAQLAESLRRAYEEFVQWNVLRIRKHAAHLRGEPDDQRRHAGAFLSRAADAFENAEDEYDYVDAIHRAVGALESVASARLGSKRVRLGKAAYQLAKRRMVSQEEAQLMQDAYRLRSDTSGVAHWAGGCSRHRAVWALFLVQAGLEVLARTGSHVSGAQAAVPLAGLPEAPVTG